MSPRKNSDEQRRQLSPEQAAAAAMVAEAKRALSGYIAHELTIRLQRHGLAVNREVLVQPTSARSGAGHRTDILVQALTARDLVDRLTTDHFAVVIEIKGPWNDDLSTAQRQQLAETYLPEASATAGIYLVGRWPPDQWILTSDRRRPRVAGLQPDLQRMVARASATWASRPSIRAFDGNLWVSNTQSRAATRANSGGASLQESQS